MIVRLAFIIGQIKLTIKLFWRRSGIFIVNFEHISHLFLVFLMLTLKKKILGRILSSTHVGDFLCVKKLNHRCLTRF